MIPLEPPTMAQSERALAFGSRPELLQKFTSPARCRRV
jgi:hypothetical protein